MRFTPKSLYLTEYVFNALALDRHAPLQQFILSINWCLVLVYVMDKKLQGINTKAFFKKVLAHVLKIFMTEVYSCMCVCTYRHPHRA